jgi:hypothetical protein
MKLALRKSKYVSSLFPKSKFREDATLHSHLHEEITTGILEGSNRHRDDFIIQETL